MHTNPGVRFDLRTEDFLARFSKMVEASKNLPLPEARKLSSSFFMPPEGDLELVSSVINVEIPVHDGNIPLRIFSPKHAAKPFPILVFCHQGGWVFGSIDESEALCRKLANHAECFVVSVGYRLAPEHQFPIPLQDCYKAVQWIIKNAENFSANPRLVAIAGASAGANLAAGVSLMARDKKEFSLCMQLLLYPTLSDHIDEKKYAKCEGARFLSAEAMKMFWSLYLKNAQDRDNPYASPLKAHDLKGLPRTLLITAEYDPLRHDSELYAARLAQDGNNVMIENYPGVLHGFLELPLAPEQKEKAIQTISEALKKSFNHN